MSGTPTLGELATRWVARLLLIAGIAALGAGTVSLPGSAFGGASGDGFAAVGFGSVPHEPFVFGAALAVIAGLLLLTTRRPGLRRGAFIVMAVACVAVAFGLTQTPYAITVGAKDGTPARRVALPVDGRGWIEAGLALTLVGTLTTMLPAPRLGAA